MPSAAASRPATCRSSRHRARREAEQQPVLDDRPGDRQEHAFPDEHEGRARRGHDHGPRNSRQQGSELTMSFISKKHIPRRTFLQASGVTLALPMLESMLPAGTAFAQTPAAQVKPRFVGVFFPHGMAPGYWVPEAEGPLPEKLPHIAESLAKLRNETTILRDRKS